MKKQPTTALDKIEGSPTTATIYKALLKRLEKVGAFVVEPKASSLHIVNGRAFLGVHYRKDSLLLNIVLDQPLESPRLKDSEQVSRLRYHHEVLITDPGEIDGELVGWLKQAHRLTKG